jgi:hypothetical protein
LVFGLLAFPPKAPAQDLAKRLVLKDGSYQLATKWEVKGDRVHYYSAEREEWEDVPNSLVDWAATEKYEKDREAGAPSAEAAALDKELEAERQAEEAKNPQVAPGLRLPDDGGIVLLDTFQGQPQLIELQQSGGDVNKNMKGNILRAAINPIASSKQSIEVPGQHAKIQAHLALPAIYVNVEQQDELDNATTADLPGKSAPPVPKSNSSAKDQRSEEAWDRFKIVRMQTKGDKRIAGDIKIAVYGKVSQEAKFVPTKAEQLTGGWVKVTPTTSLAPGEYAVVEMLGKEGMNLFVWDFGVNPSAPANTGVVLKPEPSAAQPDKPKPLEPR